MFIFFKTILHAKGRQYGNILVGKKNKHFFFCIFDNTDVTTCLAGQFRCDSGHCIDPEFVCDGDRDCQDTSDERNCTAKYPNGRFCPANKFQCNNHVSKVFLMNIQLKTIRKV